MTETNANRTDSSPINFYSGWFTRLDNRGRVFLLSGRFRILAQLIVLLILLVLIVLSSGSVLPEGLLAHVSPLIAWIAGGAAVLVVILAYTIWRELLQPLLRLCRWADLMRGVKFDATVELDRGSDFAELASDINMLSRMINQLSRETEVQLQKYTEHMSRESRSLVILYEVASSINVSRDLGELFKKSLDSLCENLHAQAGVIRQVMDNNELGVVATNGGINKAFLSKVNHLLPLPVRATGANLERSEYKVTTVLSAEALDSNDSGLADQLSAVSVAIQYRGETTGVVNLFFPQENSIDLGSYQELLVSIGQHLGTAVEKYRLDEEENQLLIMHERTQLSHELHDSLAQTIASLRIQVRVLDEIFHSNEESEIWQQLESLENAIDQANTQVRELITQFRVPMSKRGLISSIQETIQIAREETDIHIFFQNEWSVPKLSASLELHILRIIQECLANIRKHSRARSARVLLRGHGIGGDYYLLVEDDGVGFDESQLDSVGNEHFGLSILRDRARELNGEITIESEPGEGTRITLQFVYPGSIQS